MYFQGLALSLKVPSKRNGSWVTRLSLDRTCSGTRVDMSEVLINMRPRNNGKRHAKAPMRLLLPLWHLSDTGGFVLHIKRMYLTYLPVRPHIPTCSPGCTTSEILSRTKLLFVSGLNFFVNFVLASNIILQLTRN
jgi:hypothetical protein